MKHLVLLCLLFGIFGHLKAQIGSPRNEPEIPLDFSECKAKNYKFKTQNSLFSDGDKIRFCPSTLPDTIELVDLMGNPIMFTVMWTGAKTNPANNYSCIIDSAIVADGADIIAKFTDADREQELTLKNKGKASVKLSNDRSSIYAYDDNTKKDYPSYNTVPQNGIPWKFLEASKMENLEAKTSGSFQPIFFQTNKSTLSLNPDMMSMKKQIIQLNHPAELGGGFDTIDINGCNTVPELKVFVGDSIHKTVNFVYLCDSLGKCPPNIDANLIVKEANDVLNKAGLYLSINDISRDTFFVITGDRISEIYANTISDGILDRDDQRLLHNARYQRLRNLTSDYLVMIANDLGKSETKPGQVGGRAVAVMVGANSVAIDATDGNKGTVLAHELGHAAFGLAHPEDINASSHIGIKINDVANIMHEFNTEASTNFRQFQLQRIQETR